MNELDAVNQMLENINESPVDTLEAIEFTTASAALKVLRRVSNKVQAKGWTFNTEYAVPLSPNSVGEIDLPANILKVDPSDSSDEGVQRGLRLYDRANHTFTYGRLVKVDMIVQLDFSDLPVSAKHYITIKAARDFARSQVGSQTMDKLTENDENEALVELQCAEGESGDFNLIYGAEPIDINAPYRPNMFY